MKIVSKGCLIVAAFGMLACSQSNTNKFDSSTGTIKSIAKITNIEKSYPISLVNNKKDPTCGMPVTAGIIDTAHYQNKVLGFCSTECKNEFLKNPKANIAAAAIK